jgi:hypothetical protein
VDYFEFNMRPLITLTTDFGLREYFVAAMKGAILSVHREVDIVDITHEIQSHDILEAAFTLHCAYPAFPPRTIHLVVVDPGVGSARRAIIVVTANHCFVGPDNGVFSLIYENEPVERVISITAEHYFRRPVSETFHGRDIFAPVAAWIARGIDASRFGEPITDFVQRMPPRVTRNAVGALQGIVLHVDRFGNLITNLSAAELQRMGKVGEFTVAGQRIHRLVRNYAEGLPGEPVALVGSAGYFEIAVQQGSAADLLKAGRGTEVGVRLA